MVYTTSHLVVSAATGVKFRTGKGCHISIWGEATLLVAPSLQNLR